MYTLSGKPGSVKLGFSMSGAANVVTLTHQRCQSPLSQCGEGFQSDMNFSFSMREKVAVRPDKGEEILAKTPSPTVSHWARVFHKFLNF